MCCCQQQSAIKVGLIKLGSIRCILFRPKRWDSLRLVVVRLNIILGVLVVLINVAFITLLERKILGYSQLRKGPNKVGLGGLVQPFNDAIKLFSKEVINPRAANSWLFLISPALALCLVLLVWQTVFYGLGFSTMSLGLLLVYTILRINVYPLLGAGWSSNRNYSSIGALRGVAQTVSYEVSFALLILFFMLALIGVRFSRIVLIGMLKSLIVLPLVGIWVITCLAETNRTPFDFAEGESELVSGFNVEYGAVGFAIIFMAEYARIYFMSVFITLMFFSTGSGRIFSSFIAVRLVFFWVWVRCTLPRYRYDLLIDLAWKSFLPMALAVIIGSPILFL